ncbi:MAG: ArgE/DapE family deacylase [Armatimonadetes bacterium]|nr:ArgE/DapE family deacylase [Armatimonadota bacterium]
MASAEAVKARVRQEIDRRQEEFIDLCCRIVRFNTENPPGDNTGEIARFVADLLRRRGVAYTMVEPQPGMVSLTATLPGRARSPHLVFNGHFDVFPADDPSLWDFPPFCGEVRDGKILGRGVADMKAGTTASLAALLTIADLGLDLPGRLTLTLVADEETGGRWGTEWLLSHDPDLAGEGCLIGEPCGPDAVRVGEKGICWMRLVARGESFHASFSTGENSITRLAAALEIIKSVTRERGTIPDEMREVIEAAKRQDLTRHLAGKGHLLEQPSLNVGMIRGGIKINIVPRTSEAEVDVRLPLGMHPERTLALLQQRLAAAGFEDLSLSLMMSSVPNYTSPNSALAQMARRNATAVRGETPTFTMTTAATDGRFYRARGVPTVIYGPRPLNIAGLNEFVPVEEFLTVLKVHAATAVDFLWQAQ